MTTYLVNLFGGPGAGKSTIASHVFAKLKWLGYTAELALEFAKELVWEENYSPLDNQIYLFGNQLQRIRRLQGKVDFIITDSPLMLSAIFGKDCSEGYMDSFYKLIMDVHRSLDNINFFIEREKGFKQAGRIHSEGQSIFIDEQIRSLLDMEAIDCVFVAGNYAAADKIVDILETFGGWGK